MSLKSPNGRGERDEEKEEKRREMANSVKNLREGGWRDNKWERQDLSGACACVLNVFLDILVCQCVSACTDIRCLRFVVHVCVQAGQEGWPGAG